ATTPPSASELKQAQLQMLRDLELSEASVSDIASGLVQRADAEQPLDEPTRRAHAIVELTPAQVSAAFAKWIDPARFVEVVQGPAAGSPAK
ncbi:MAG TPA: hypothetical protein VKG44_03545, partial [Candidatus Baltobacteraceae bacterium]|nr:hypothetical protein [Candidatus Baltobacteraceae bacterium]